MHRRRVASEAPLTTRKGNSRVERSSSDRLQLEGMTFCLDWDFQRYQTCLSVKDKKGWRLENLPPL